MWCYMIFVIFVAVSFNFSNSFPLLPAVPLPQEFVELLPLTLALPTREESSSAQKKFGYLGTAFGELKGPYIGDLPGQKRRWT